jgi:hypothetical protein
VVQLRVVQQLKVLRKMRAIGGRARQAMRAISTRRTSSRATAAAEGQVCGLAAATGAQGGVMQGRCHT